MSKREKELVSRIDELRGQIGGYRETLDAMSAMMTAAIRQTGPMTIQQEDIRGIMDSGAFAVGHYDAEAKAYVLHLPEGVKTDGEDGEKPTCQQG